MDQQSKPDRHDLLANMFTDRRFELIDRWLYLANIDGTKIAVVIATKNTGYFEYALNRARLDRLLIALHKGKVDEGYVVLARMDADYKPNFTGYREAEE